MNATAGMQQMPSQLTSMSVGYNTWLYTVHAHLMTLYRASFELFLDSVKSSTPVLHYGTMATTEVAPPRYGPPADHQRPHLPNNFVPQLCQLIQYASSHGSSKDGYC